MTKLTPALDFTLPTCYMFQTRETAVPNEQRAFLLGLLGPALSLTGLVWEFGRAAFAPYSGTVGLHYLVFNGPLLLIEAGVFVSLVAIPLAIQVALARPDEVSIPVFEPVEGEDEVQDMTGQTARA
ncbi:MAG: hypothetical protein WEB00_10360 [Dehalococcoidia bacterium]